MKWFCNSTPYRSYFLKKIFSISVKDGASLFARAADMKFLYKGTIKIAFSFLAYKLLLCLDNDFPKPLIISRFFSSFFNSFANISKMKYPKLCYGQKFSSGTNFRICSVNFQSSENSFRCNKIFGFNNTSNG